MPTTARTGLGWSQGPVTLSWFPRNARQAHRYWSHQCCLLECTPAGSWIRSRAVKTQTRHAEMGCRCPKWRCKPLSQTPGTKNNSIDLQGRGTETKLFHALGHSPELDQDEARSPALQPGSPHEQQESSCFCPPGCPLG